MYRPVVLNAIIIGLVLYLFRYVDAHSLVDGQWGSWQPWACDRSCGGGRDHRERLCDSPAPAGGGAQCPGLTHEIREVCHAKPCPGMDPDEAHLLAHVQFDLENSTLHDRYQLVLPTGENAVLDCEHEALKRLGEFYTDLTIHWSHNFYEIIQDTARVYHDDTQLLLSPVKPRDTGVYFCEARFNDNESRIIKVLSLAVTSLVATVFVPLGRPLPLHSNEAPLALMLDNLQITWYHEDLAYYQFTGTEAARAREAQVDALTRQDLGVWFCEVIHPATKRKWMTNWLRVGLARRRPVPLVTGIVEVLCMILGILVLILLTACLTMVGYSRLNPLQKVRLKQRVAGTVARLSGADAPYERLANLEDNRLLLNNGGSDDGSEGGLVGVTLIQPLDEDIENRGDPGITCVSESDLPMETNYELLTSAIDDAGYTGPAGGAGVTGEGSLYSQGDHGDIGDPSTTPGCGSGRLKKISEASQVTQTEAKSCGSVNAVDESFL